MNRVLAMALSACLVLVAAVGVVLLLTTTTTGGGTRGPAITGSQAIAQSRADAAAPAAFRARAAFRPCGDVVLDQGESIPEPALARLAGSEASGRELVVSSPTTEGDPIVSFYRVGPGIAGVDVFTDNSFDSFGSGTWQRSACARPAIGDRVLCG